MSQGRTNQRVTLAAVARKAGVAESTASRIMNGYTRNFRVRPEVRERVLQAAADLNYQPNPMVRSIAAKRTNLVAVIGSPCGEALGTAVRAAAATLLEHRIHLGTSFFQPTGPVFGAPSWRVDGVIAAGMVDSEELGALVSDGTPCVCIDGPRVEGADAVCVDERGAVEAAVKHLKSNGWGETLYVQSELGDDAHNSEFIRERQAGAFEELCSDGPGSPLSITADGTDASDRKIVDAVRDRRSPGIVASDVPTAMRVVQLADEAGLRVTRDLAVVSLRDLSLGALTTPALTSVRAPMEELGTRAAEVLLERFGASDDDPPAPDREELIAGDLIERASTPMAEFA